MSHLPHRSVREVEAGVYEVNPSLTGEYSDEDDEAMFEFDSDTEAAEYQRGQAALIEELRAKKAKEEFEATQRATNTNANAASLPTTSTASSSSATPAVGGMATVVQVGADVSKEGEVKVGLDVFDRYVPHLNANKIAQEKEEAEAAAKPTSAAAAVSSSPTSTTANKSTTDRTVSSSSDDSDSDSDSDDGATGEDLVLTGDLDKDQATLAALMAGKDTEMKNDDDEADDDDESSSDDDDDEEDIARRAEAASLEDIGSDEEPDALGKVKGVYTKNELKPDQIPIPEEFEITDETPIEEIGFFTSCLDRVLVIEAIPGRSTVLDIGSAICTNDRKPVGRVEEVMGLVSEPYYAVRLCASYDPSNLPDPLDDDLQKGVSFSYVPSLSSFASADSRPGTDASNLHDEEVPEDEQEFSDDEAEAEAKAERKAKNKAKAIEKKKAAAAASGGSANENTSVLPGGNNPSPSKNRTILKAKRNRTSGGQTNASATPASTSASTAPPPFTMPNPQQTVPPQNGAYPPYAFPPQPMAGYNYFTPGVAYAHPHSHSHHHPHTAHSQAAYAQYYAHNPQASVYGYGYPSAHPASQPGAVSGGFAGWGSQNLVSSNTQSNAPQHPPYYPFQPQQPYGQPSYPTSHQYYATAPAASPPTATAPTSTPPTQSST